MITMLAMKNGMWQCTRGNCRWAHIKNMSSANNKARPPDKPNHTVCGRLVYPSILELEDGIQRHFASTNCACREVFNKHICHSTAALEGSMLNQQVERDPWIGITDGRVTYEYVIHNIGNYRSLPPCRASETHTQKNPPTGTFTFFFKQAKRFGVCSTAQNGGYINADIFTIGNQLDKVIVEDILIWFNLLSQKIILRFRWNLNAYVHSMYTYM